MGIIFQNAPAAESPEYWPIARCMKTMGRPNRARQIKYGMKKTPTIII